VARPEFDSTSARFHHLVTVHYCINRGPGCLSAKMSTAVGKTPHIRCRFRNRIKAIDEQIRSRAKMLPVGDVHGGRRMMESGPKAGKPYERSTVTKLTPEQAKLKLLGQASMGNQGAKELLELMFPDVPSKDSKAEKNSA
jgi:hypothetical protein